jgi:cytochrome c oxidase subunit II
MDGKKLRPVVGIILLVAMIVLYAADYAAAEDRVVRIAAKQFVYTPKEITLKKGEPVAFEFTSADVMHGFNCPDLGIRADILPGKVTTLRFAPQKVGVFPFHCDNFCGSGHENMTGTITVKD